MNFTCRNYKNKPSSIEEVARKKNRLNEHIKNLREL